MCNANTASMPSADLLRALEESMPLADLPAVLIVGADRERALKVATRVAARSSGGRVEMEGHAYFDRHVEVEGVVQREHAPDGGQQQQLQIRASVRAAYGPCGALLLDAACPPHRQPGAAGVLVALAKSASVQRQVGTRSRRVVVIHGVDVLATHLQHALRRVVEATTANALFVMTATGQARVDEPLRGRTLTVACGSDPSARLTSAGLVPEGLDKHLSALEVAGAACAAGRRPPNARLSRAADTAARAIVACAVAAARSGGGCSAAAAEPILRVTGRAIERAVQSSDESAPMRVVAAGAACDHALRSHPGCDPEWLVRRMLLEMHDKTPQA